MYSRRSTDGFYSRNINVPSNYSGNAFSYSQADEISTDTPNDQNDTEYKINSESENDTIVSESAEAIAMDKKEPEITKPHGLFKGGGIGFEELLILGVILLISQNDSKDDLAFLLMLLLFIQ